MGGRQRTSLFMTKEKSSGGKEKKVGKSKK